MSTQTETVIVCLREMIMRGEFAAGEKLGEAQLAERLGVSRTPVRLALTELANEGLLQYRTNRGFEVTSFSIDWIADAVAVREQLEGLAARRVATQGLSPAQDKVLTSCILQVDGLTQIVSEVITNAVKYFHATGEPGQVRVSCRRTSDQQLEIEVSDDGEGLPDLLDPAAAGGLGFRLIRALTAQIGARSGFETSRSGTRFWLSIASAPQSHRRDE